jgi:hypothetical protein
VFIVGLVLLLRKVVMVVVLKTKIKKGKANGVAKLGFVVLKKRTLVFVMNVKSFPAKYIPKK